MTGKRHRSAEDEGPIQKKPRWWWPSSQIGAEDQPLIEQLPASHTTDAGFEGVEVGAEESGGRTMYFSETTLSLCDAEQDLPGLLAMEEKLAWQVELLDKGDDEFDQKELELEHKAIALRHTIGSIAHRVELFATGNLQHSSPTARPLSQVQTLQKRVTELEQDLRKEQAQKEILQHNETELRKRIQKLEKELRSGRRRSL